MLYASSIVTHLLSKLSAPSLNKCGSSLLVFDNYIELLYKQDPSNQPWFGICFGEMVLDGGMIGENHYF